MVMDQTSSTYDGSFFESTDHYAAWLEGMCRGLKFAQAEAEAAMPEDARRLSRVLASGGTLLMHPDDAATMEPVAFCGPGVALRLSLVCPRGSVIALSKTRGIFYGGGWGTR